ncbi:hypothetical protein BDQ12DRAFT_679334 [Crucibulum laeve]|uniref:Uncharacterized protein n=1 Tax=Crucibulum laeve TaxID=68775 RepID=A0A5C3M7H7_9AGAR|nr:hypothetical protein BDQ12DRAFT_679334 [Crucibulum laeve]
MSRPVVSSPLADSSSARTATQRIAVKRNTSFPSSRALRPFASISHAFQQPGAGPTASSKKPMKLIQPPENFKATFVLNLTQAELSRQD